MKTLFIGGTRFVGKALVSNLLKKGCEITTFTRGLHSIPDNVRHIKGDRNTDDVEKLKGLKFDLIIDSSGRTKEQTKRILDNFETYNIHLSYLPQYRGRHPLHWAIINGEKEPVDRDHFKYKRIETSGDLMFQLCNEYLNLQYKT